MRRVVVTGIGVITALGTGAEATWQALLEGRSDIEAVRFVHDPEPDYVGADPDDLPY